MLFESNRNYLLRFTNYKKQVVRQITDYLKNICIVGNLQNIYYFLGIYGGAKRDRTADLNTASVALSQLSYSPIIGIESYIEKYF